MVLLIPSFGKDCILGLSNSLLERSFLFNANVFSFSEMVEFEVNQLFTGYCLRELRKYDSATFYQR